MERPQRMFVGILPKFFRLLGQSALIGACLCTSLTFAQQQVASLTPRTTEKRVIGPTTIVEEANSELAFKARVDTGATTTSLHVEEWAIENESKVMAENIGKKIRFRMKNHRGESQWMETQIEEIALVKTAAHQEERYKVLLTICWKDMKKQVMVTLNDRSHMEYPMLLGRNFLEGDFVVDVDLYKKPKPEVAPIEEASAAGDK